MNSRTIEFFKSVEAAINAAVPKIPPPDGVVYACGFWLFYCDNTMLGCPCFAYNIIGNENDAKWSPPEWLIDVDDAVVEAINPLYQEFSENLANLSDEEWNALVQYQWGFYASMCHRMKNSTLFSNWSLSDDFVVGIFEERECEEIYNQLVLTSVGERDARKLQII